MKSGAAANTCVHGDKTAGDGSLDADTFSADGDPGCGTPLPYMCEQNACTLCDTCVERIYTGVSAFFLASSCSECPAAISA